MAASGSRSCLDEPFKDVAEVLKLGYTVSPRAMRRTFQDLAREAKDVVARAICDHTMSMNTLVEG